MSINGESISANALSFGGGQGEIQDGLNDDAKTKKVTLSANVVTRICVSATTKSSISQSNYNGVDSTGSGSGQASSSSNKVPEGYYWSGQDNDYIREYDDSNGLHHIDRMNGPNEAIDTVNNKHYTNGIEDTEAYNQDFN